MDLAAFDPFSSGNARSIDQILLEMGFYTVHQGLSIGLTPVQPDYNSSPAVMHLTAAHFHSCAHQG